MSDNYDSLRAKDPGKLLWSGAEPLGHYSAFGLVGTGPLSILSGFALASSLAVATQLSERAELLDVAAVALFALSAALLFGALITFTEASAYNVSPNERLDWYPEARISLRWLEEVRQRQHRDFARYYYLRRRTLRLFLAGTTLSLFALALVLLARMDGVSFGIDSSADALSDAVLFLGAVGLLIGAGWLLSHVPSKPTARLHQRRDEASLARGMSLLGWAGVDESIEVDAMGPHVVLKDYPPPGD